MTYKALRLFCVFFFLTTYAFAQPTVNGDTISWPSVGWWQVQSPATGQYDLCNSSVDGNSCQVEPGRYVVINHSTGDRFENVSVESSVTVTQELSPPSPDPAEILSQIIVSHVETFCNLLPFQPPGSRPPWDRNDKCVGRCPAGEIVLGGGCYAVSNQPPPLGGGGQTELRTSGNLSSTGYTCWAQENAWVTVTVSCLSIPGRN